MEESPVIPVLCPGCQAVNRVDLSRAEARPVCGRCKAALEPRAPGYPIELDDQSFESQVTRAGLPVLVDFWAPWCGPCRALAPSIEHLAREKAGQLRVVKVNVDEARLTARRYRVQSVPSLVLFRGIEAGRLTGAHPLETLRSFVDRYLAN